MARMVSVLGVVALAVAACGSQSVAGSGVATPSVSAGAEPTPSPPHEPAHQAVSIGFRMPTVRFANLPEGAYPVHLHSRCSAGAAFHLAVIGFLAVGRDGQGAITVPPRDFGHGWCLIVYGSDSLQTVLATRGL